MSGAPRAKLLLVLMAVAMSVGLALRPGGVYAADQSPDTVTIQAQAVEKLRHQVDHFVSGSVVHYSNDSLERWITPVCPLVSGLTGEQGEFVLARVSEIARTSHVPLAGERCTPNLFIVVVNDPDAVAKRWTERYRTRLFNTCNGIGYIKDFIQARGPVRVYYNAEFRASNGAPSAFSVAGLNQFGLTLNFFALPSCAAISSVTGTRVAYGAVQSLSSVVILVDSKRTVDLNIGQLSDYLAMVGFAQIRPDADTGVVPTILRLFRQADQPPQGLTTWDKALLYSLYTTDQRSVMQVSAIKTGMLQQLEH